MSAAILSYSLKSTKFQQTSIDMKIVEQWRLQSHCRYKFETKIIKSLPCFSPTYWSTNHGGAEGSSALTPRWATGGNVSGSIATPEKPSHRPKVNQPYWIQLKLNLSNISHGCFEQIKSRFADSSLSPCTANFPKISNLLKPHEFLFV